MRPLTAGKRRETLIRRRVEFVIKYPALVRLNRQMLRKLHRLDQREGGYRGLGVVFISVLLTIYAYKKVKGLVR